MLKRHWKLSVTLALVLLAVLSVVGYQIFVTGAGDPCLAGAHRTGPAAGTVSGDLVVDPGWQYGEVLQADLHADNEAYPVPLARREDGDLYRPGHAAAGRVAHLDGPPDGQGRRAAGPEPAAGGGGGHLCPASGAETDLERRDPRL